MYIYAKGIQNTENIHLFKAALTNPKNNGCGLAVASTTKFYLSTNTTYEAGDTPLGSRSVPSLSGSVISTGTTNVTIPLGIATGTWYIIAVADDSKVVVESNETNNTKYKAITITP